MINSVQIVCYNIRKGGEKNSVIIELKAETFK